MKVYDVALMLIRALMALDIIREVVSLVYDIVRSSLVVLAGGGSTYLKVVEGTTIASPIIGLAVTFTILANAKRIARFAARLSAPDDAAATFH